MNPFMKGLLVVGIVGVALPALAQKNPKDSLKGPPTAADPALSSLLPTITPQSPNVAALGRFGEHPVSLFTGLPTIEIPLYDVVAGSIQVPVKLGYHAGGNRVTDQASWVGLGWALQAGGQVTRTVVGKPDDSGMLNTPLHTGINVFGGDESQCSQDRTDLTAYANGSKDTGYDIFSVSTPGLSLRFILVADGTSQATLMPNGRQQVSYSRDGGGVITQFVITDTDGLIYTFADREFVAIGTQNLAYVSAWHLTSIRGLAAQEDVRFSYTSAPGFDNAADWTYTQAVIDDFQGPGSCGPSLGVQIPTLSPLTTTFSPLLLSEISFPGGKLAFTPGSTSRTDLPTTNGGQKALERVKLWGWNLSSNGYELIRQFALQQSYFTPAANNTNAPLRLDGVQLQNNTGTPIGQYSCAYNTQLALPDRQSTSRDAWGYYNGKTNNYATAPYTQQPTLIPLQTVTLNAPGNQTVTVGGANRNVDAAFMQAWILTQLTYPTGGNSQFVYETNRYADGNNIPPLAGGLRIIQINTQASPADPVQTKTYSYGAGRVLNLSPSASGLRQGFWQSAYNTRLSVNCTNYRTTVFGSTYNAG